jgi:hypothetical protein
MLDDGLTKSVVLYELCLIVLLLCDCILGLAGKVDFTVRHLSSSTASFPSSWAFNSGQQCVGNGVHQVFSPCNILLVVIDIFCRTHFVFCPLYFTVLCILC